MYYNYTFSKDVRMVEPKTTNSKCRDGSMQARQGIQRLQLTPFFVCDILRDIQGKALFKYEDVEMGLLVVFVHPILPSHCYPYTYFLQFWHYCHCYIPLHLWKMTCLLMHMPPLCFTFTNIHTCISNKLPCITWYILNCESRE